MPKLTKNLLNEQDGSKASEVSTRLLSAPSVEAEDCPWVKVGQLYLSLTITGEESWLPLVRLLRSQGQKTFTVFSGRHGDIPNGVSNWTGKTDSKLFDSGHYDEDVDRVKVIQRECPGVTVELIDTGKQQGGQTEWLKKESIAHLQKGNAVIYAWCYSMFTMCEHDADAPKQVVESHQLVEINKSVAQLVRDWFRWVPRSPFPGRDPSHF